MKLDDLSAAEQRLVRTGRATTSARGASAPTVQREGRPHPTGVHPRQGQPPREPKPLYQCHGCRETFTAWAPAERHADQPGHRRILWIGGLWV